MPCNATSQLTNAPSVPLQVTMPTNNAQWAVFVQRLQDAINATRDAANRTGVNVVPAAYAVYDAAALPALSINGASAALDGTKSQFGKASLKLTATAATVTVSFTGNPIAINAYQRWIESVYIQSSRASIAGTLAVVTPAASYPVDISGTLLPATWGRLYGDCSLIADASTQATMTLTLTGCSVGDTFNLEGWQLEQAAGNTNLPSAFVNSAAPGSQDTLPDGSSFVRLAGSHASGNVAYNYKGVWSSATAYVTGDETVYSGSYWLALAPNTNSAPAQGNGNWQVVGAYNNYQGAWSSTVTYYAGQETTYNGNYWVATATNTNSAPSTSNANWVIAGPTNLDKVADGTARFAVINGAGLKAVSSVDANNRAGIDFTQSLHVGKSLANMPDDATSGRYAVSNIDANRRALIDFTQASHVGKVIDNIGDGVTYGRPYLSRLNAGRPWIDFSEAIHANQHLGNMPDNAASSRYAVASIDANRRALIDATQAGHIGAWNLDSRVADGTTYLRMPGANMDANRRGLIDFAQGGHLGKSLANIPDDAGTTRYAVSNIDANRRALIDFGQAAHLGKHLGNIPDDATSTRYAVSNIDANRRALIDATQAGHIGAWNLDSRVVDGTNFQRVGSGYADTSGRIVNLWDGVAIRSATATWDGANRARTGLDSGGVLVAGLHPVDNLKDGVFGRVRAGQLNNGIVNIMQGGRNCLLNPTFVVNNTAAVNGDLYQSGPLVDHWACSDGNASSGAIPYNGTLRTRIYTGFAIANGITYGTSLVSDNFPVSPGTQYVVRASRFAGSVGGALPPPAGVTAYGRFYVYFADYTGALIANQSITDVDLTTAAANTQGVASGTVPTGASQASVRAYVYFQNSGAATAVGGSAGYIDFGVNEMEYLVAANLDSDVVDGATNGRVAMADVVDVGGANRVGLGQAGSGMQVGDQRNLHPITVASLRSVLNISPITYTITSGSPNSTVNFSVAAFTLQAGSAAINYNAASHSIAQANGTTTTWYLLFIDPGYAGGTQSLVVTTSPTVAAQYDGAVNIGNATVTVASGGGGSSGSGSGGGGWCVCDDMWIDAETQAKDAQPGHVFDCCDLPTRGTETFKRALQSADYHDEECVRLTTEGGAVLDCGHTTPFDTVDGRTLRAPDMQGELVLTDHGLEKVASVEWIGVRRVCYFHFGGISYAAGRDTRPWYLRWLPQWLLPRRLRRNVDRIYSHNTAAKP